MIELAGEPSKTGSPKKGARDGLPTWATYLKVQLIERQASQGVLLGEGGGIEYIVDIQALPPKPIGAPLAGVPAQCLKRFPGKFAWMPERGYFTKSFLYKPYVLCLPWQSAGGTLKLALLI